MKSKIIEFYHTVFFKIYDTTAAQLCKIAYRLENKVIPYFDLKAGNHYTEKMEEAAEQAYKQENEKLTHEK